MSTASVFAAQTMPSPTSNVEWGMVGQGTIQFTAGVTVGSLLCLGAATLWATGTVVTLIAGTFVYFFAVSAFYAAWIGLWNIISGIGAGL